MADRDFYSLQQQRASAESHRLHEQRLLDKALLQGARPAYAVYNEKLLQRRAEQYSEAVKVRTVAVVFKSYL